MKIAILTQTLHNNYGGLLQNYALQQVLILGGYSPCTINHSRTQRIIFLRRLSRRIKAHVRHLLYPNKYSRPGYVANRREESVISRNTDYFIDKYIRHTKTLVTHKEFKEIGLANEYQAYIVGSDQCWRPLYNKSFLKEMFLNFVEKNKNIKRIAYAASFGKDEWDLPNEIITECACLAKKFDLVTVREDSGITLCKQHLGVSAYHVLDPTMLLPKDDYIKLVEEENEPQSPGNLFYYILDPSEDKQQFVMDAANKMGLVPFTVMPIHPRDYRTKKDIKKHIEDCVYPSVTLWLRAFMDAEMVIVDSFHGMVFSIIFNKPFWVIGNPDRGMSRFTSLLKMFDLEKRMILINQLAGLNLRESVDWDRVNRLKDDYSCFSLSLLYGALND